MTVSQLIEFLNKVQDKNKRVLVDATNHSNSTPVLPKQLKQLVNYEKCFVYFGGRFAYKVDWCDELKKDIQNYRMEPVSRADKYNKDTDVSRTTSNKRKRDN